MNEEMENHDQEQRFNNKPMKEKLTVRFESIDNDSDLTDTDEIEDSSGTRFISDYFSNEEFFREDFVKLAEDVIGEKVNWRNQDINTLKEMLHNYDQHLAKELTSDELLKFLRSRCFDYDNTLSTIKNYHILIKSNRDYYFQPISKLSEIFSDAVIYVLPILVQQHVTIIITPEKYDSTKHTYNQFLSALFHTLERILYSEIAQITGINFIIDLQSFSISKLKKFSPINAKKLLFYLEETFPIRINAVYIVGSKIISNLVYALCKPFLSQMLRSKIEFHNLSSLHQIYSTEILNSNLGGKLDEMNSDRWYLELVRAESMTCTLWNKFCTVNNGNLSKASDPNEDISESDNNLLDSQNGCNTNGHTNLPSFFHMLPIASCSDYFMPNPVYK